MTESMPSEPVPAGDEPYAVGKGRPPVHSRWKPGESGARRIAQPPLAVRTAVVERVLAREVEVQVAGKAAWMPLGEAVVMRLTERAVHGEVTAMTELIRLMGEAEKQRVEEARRQAERSQRCAERRRAREAERKAAARGPEDAGQFYPLEGPPVEEALLALDVIGEDENGDLRVRSWVKAAAEYRTPWRWSLMTQAERSAIWAASEPPTAEEAEARWKAAMERSAAEAEGDEAGDETGGETGGEMGVVWREGGSDVAPWSEAQTGGDGDGG